MIFGKFRKKFLKLHLRSSIVVASLVSLSITTAIFLVWYSNEQQQKVLVSQFQSRQLSMARSVGYGLETFFQSVRPEIAYLAKGIGATESENRLFLQDAIRFLKEKNDLVEELFLVDEEGTGGFVVTPDELVLSSEVDISLVDRNYFIWARDEGKSGETFVSEPILARGGVNKGKWMVVISSPVVRNGEFDGILAATVLVEDLIGKHLISLLPIDVEMKGALVSRTGYVIGGTIEKEHIGKKIEDCLDTSDPNWEKDRFRDTFLSGQSGSLRHLCAFFHDSENRPQEMVTSFAPTHPAGFDWVVLISTPFSEIRKIVKTWQTVQFLGITVALTSALVSLGLSIYLRRVSEKKAFFKGLEVGRGKRPR